MSRLFETTRIGSMTLKNRIFRAAMGDHDAVDGHYGAKDLQNYERTAQGGVGAIITGYSYVADYPMGGKARMTAIDSDEYIDEYRRLTETVHRSQCALIHQLVHVGSATAVTDADIIGPSPVEGPYNGQMPREMDAGDIRRVEKAFSDAAVRAKTAGFDGVEVHAAHKFLLSQFLSPHYNKRTDAYGQTDEGRARFTAEVCEQIRHAVGPDYPILFKVNCDDGNGIEDGITLSGLLTACRMLEEAGASAVEISGAWMDYKQDTPYFLEQTSEAAACLRIPVILTGGVRGREQAEKILEETDIQYIGMARPFVKDPDLVKEWASEQGI